MQQTQHRLGSTDTRFSMPRVENKAFKPSTTVLRRAYSSRPATRTNAGATAVSPPTAQGNGLSPETRHSSYLTGSSSVPTHRFPGRDLEPDAPDGIKRGRSAFGAMSADEVNAKVGAMLAATEALKPAALPAPDAGASRLSRLVHRVSSALEKVQTRAPLTDLDLNEEAQQIVTAVELATKPGVETIHIRLNESHNLNRKKVQKIVGTQITRKPVVDDGKSLRSKRSGRRQSVEDPPCPTPGTTDSLSVNEEDEVPTTPACPFQSEEGFDNDLEFRILSIIPEASSTPKAISPILSVLGCSSEEISASSTDDQRMGEPSLHEIDMFLSTATPERLVQKRLAADDTLEHPGMDGSPDDCKRMKKHPSPDKQYLESLEEALQKYKSLKMSGADDTELDELADNFSTPVFRSLAPLDSNRLMGNAPQRNRRSSIFGHRGRGQASLYPNRPVHTFKSCGVALNSPHERCPVSQLRPKDVGADDSDELL